MKDEKIVQYLFSSKKKKKMIGESLDDMHKYDARLLSFLSSDKVRDAVDMLTLTHTDALGGCRNVPSTPSERTNEDHSTHGQSTSSR